MQTSFDFEYPADDCCPHCGESWLDGETLYCLDIRADKRERFAVFVPCCEGISEDVSTSEDPVSQPPRMHSRRSPN